MAAGGGASATAPDDLTKLPQLSEDAVIAALKERLMADTIYTQVNAMIVAVNPCKLIDGIYSDEMLRRYLSSDPNLPPHVYLTAARLHRGVLQGRSQSVVISGESGAGKTESFKRVIQYISLACSPGQAGAKGPQAGRSVEQLLVDTVPVLESFGNASTVHNPNSSRFGKFVMLHFMGSGVLMGVSVKTYLLEKTRAVLPGPGERSFHFFYELLRGAGAAALAPLHLEPRPASRYLPQASFDLPVPRDDGKELGALETAMAAADMPRAETDELYKTIAAVVHLGGVAFASIGEEGQGQRRTTVTVEGEEALQRVATLLGCDLKALRFALCAKNIKAGAEWIETPNSMSAAAELCDGLAKAVYARAFDWLVAQVNRAVSAQQGGGGGFGGGGGGGGSMLEQAPQYVGVLDIFGFEIFAVNSLEQLCINFANEKLQGIFNHVMLLAAKEEYAKEGLPDTALDFDGLDNVRGRALIEQKHTGLFAILEEECQVPKGSDSGVVSKLFEAAGKKHPNLRRPQKVKLGFVVKHYAGDVVYDGDGFVDKNKDRCPEDLLVLLRNSSREFVAMLMGREGGGGGKAGRAGKFMGVVAKFQAQLAELAGLLSASDCFFIRCIKPNAQLQPRVFNREKVQAQLQCCAVMETCQIFAAGFPDRMLFAETVRAFRVALFGLRPRRPMPPAAALADAARARAECARLLEALAIDQARWQLGKSKLFLKTGCLVELEHLRQLGIVGAATLIAAVARGAQARREAAERRAARKAAAEAAAKAAAEAEAAAARKAAAGAAAPAAADAPSSSVWRRLSLTFKAVDALPLTNPDGTPRKQSALSTRKGSFGRKRDRKRDEAAAAGVPPLAPPPAEEANALRVGAERWHVSDAGKVRQTVVKHVGEPDAAAGCRFIMVAFIRGGQAPFVTRENRLFEVPPGEAQIEALRLEAEAERHAMTARQAPSKTEQELEEEKAERARARRAENLRLLKEQMSRNWTLWHPVCRPPGAHPVLEPKKGLEDVPRDVLEYAHYLGMLFPEDNRFLWIAEEGWFADVPTGWEMRKDPEGLVYFYDESTGVSRRQSPADDSYRAMYYSQKYSEAENGAYVTQLLSCVESRGLTDCLKNLGAKEVLKAAEAFGKFDPERSGVISQANFIARMQELGGKTGKKYSPVRLRAMFEGADLTSTGEVDFNEFVLMQQKKDKREKHEKHDKADRKKERREGERASLGNPGSGLPTDALLAAHDDGADSGRAQPAAPARAAKPPTPPKPPIDTSADEFPDELPLHQPGSSAQGAGGLAPLQPAGAAASVGLLGGMGGMGGLGVSPTSSAQQAQSMNEQLAMQLQMVAQQQQMLMQQMNSMALMPAFQGSMTQQQMFGQFSMLQNQQQMLMQQQAASAQQMALAQQQQQQLSRTAGAMGRQNQPGGRSSTRRGSGPYNNGALDDAYGRMVDKQAASVRKQTRKEETNETSGGDLEAAKLLGGMAMNAIRETTKSVTRASSKKAVVSTPAPETVAEEPMDAPPAKQNRKKSLFGRNKK